MEGWLKETQKEFLFVLIHVLLIRLSGVRYNRSDPTLYGRSACLKQLFYDTQEEWQATVVATLPIGGVSEAINFPKKVKEHGKTKDLDSDAQGEGACGRMVGR